jgi:serine/threonine protein kinase
MTSTAARAEAPAPPSADDPRVVQALEEYIAAMEAGSPPPRDEFLARHADIAAVLGDCLFGLEMVHHAGRTRPAGDPAPAANGDGLAEMEPLGDFQIVREVGRGGMGVVYEAVQRSLGRRVALKVLPFAATLDPRHLQRFHNEARAAAGLHHTNIVPVYAVGCERGVHFYAMQFIDGRTLADFIAQQRGGPPSQVPTVLEAEGVASAPTVPPAAQATSAAPRDRAYFRQAAEWGIQAAEALDCAHTLGVVHRDVKPANLLVDTAGRLWITDFGLAQVQSDARLTMTGDLVGTLRYMSPEQALARRVVIDHRTDVYSLGATLYELLTLQPAFAGTDRQELLRQIAFEESKAPRRVNKAIPAELETIVLKALEKDPADRYATAKDLADDLRHWLECRPIRARRPSLVQRARKWAQRHRPVVAAAFLVLAVALVALAASTVLLWRQQDLTRKALWQANAQRDRAHRRLRLTLSGLDEMTNVVSECDAQRSPVLKQARQDLADKALQVYGSSLEPESPDPLVREEAGRLYLAMGHVYRRQGELARAEEAYARAVATLTELVPEFPGDGDHEDHLDQSRTALELLRASRQIAAGQPPEGFPAPSGDQLELAKAYAQLAGKLDRVWPREAAAAQRQAVAVWERLAAAAPRVGDHHRALFASYLTLQDMLSKLGESREQAAVRERAGAVGEQLAGALPDTLTDSQKVPDYYAQASQYRALGDGLQRVGKRRAAEAAYREAQTAYRRAAGLLERRVVDRWDSPTFGAMVAGSMVPGTVQLAILGWCLGQEGMQQAGPLLEPRFVVDLDLPVHSEQATQEVLSVRRFRRNVIVDYCNELVNCYAQVAHLCQKAGRPGEAEQAYRQALAALEKRDAKSMGGATVMVTDPSTAREERRQYWVLGGRDYWTRGLYHTALGDCLWSMDRHREATEEYRHATDDYQKGVEQYCRRLELTSATEARLPGTPYPVGTARLLDNLAWLLATCPCPEVRDPRRAVELAKAAAQLVWDGPDSKTVSGFAGPPRAAMMGLGGAEEGSAWKTLGVARYRAGDWQWAVPYGAQEGSAWNTLGVARYRAGDWQAAVTALWVSMQLRKGGDSCDFFFLAMARWQLGEKDRAKEWYEKAVAWMDENRPDDEELRRFRDEAEEVLELKKK